ncbi:unnamed protein product, partial [Darwinula stevensoni]
KMATIGESTCVCCGSHEDVFLFRLQESIDFRGKIALLRMFGLPSNLQSLEHLEADVCSHCDVDLRSIISFVNMCCTTWKKLGFQTPRNSIVTRSLRKLHIRRSSTVRDKLGYGQKRLARSTTHVIEENLDPDFSFPQASLEVASGETMEVASQPSLPAKGSKKYTCEECHENFSSGKAFASHCLEAHGSVRPFKCPSCEKRQDPHCYSKMIEQQGFMPWCMTRPTIIVVIYVVKFSNNQQHFQIINGDVILTSLVSRPLILILFICPVNHSSHISFKESQNSKKEHCRCSDCGRILASKSELNRHIQTVHEMRRDHLCSKCGRSFSSNTSLTGMPSCI